MRQDTILRGALWLCLAAAPATGWLLVRPRPLTSSPTPSPAPIRAEGRVPMPAESLARLVRHDPFRLEREPAPIAYDPARGQEVREPTPGPVRPELTLAGMVHGGNLNSSALIEGLPNTDGPRLLQIGDTSGGIEVRRIDLDQVVLVGYDTVWTLRMRHPWD
jgi:hypothetical protein